MDDILLAAGVKPKDSSTRSRLHALLAEHREKKATTLCYYYPVDDLESMVLKIKAFAKDNAPEFSAAKPVPVESTLPWDSGVGEKRKMKKHPVDKVWDSALDILDKSCRAKNK